MNVLVSVICTSYNQSRYIAVCLDSLLNQMTSFDYEIIVHDDASTDGTDAIVREYANKYPDKIVAILQKENQYSQGVDIWATLISKAKGKYIAMCEGDDFWTDPEKMEIQTQYMEKHPNCSLTAHAAYLAKENGTLDAKHVMRPYSQSRAVSTEEVLSGWHFATNSQMYRKKDLGSGHIPYMGDCKSADFVHTTYLALQGTVFYFDRLMSAYRENSVGSLNWTWIRNREALTASKKSFIEMLRRLDGFSKFKYHETLSQYIEQNEFQICVINGELPEARRHTEAFSRLSYKTKLSLYLKYYFPNVATMLQKVKYKHS